MGLFDFLKSTSKKSTIDFTDYKFISDDHTRIEQGRPTNANNKGAWRGIRIRTSDNSTFFVSIYNMNENHPVWANNIQMAEKRMKLIHISEDKMILRGFGTDGMGNSFADYGITINKSNGDVSKIALHMHDRNIDIVYEKAGNIKQATANYQQTDLDIFKDFTHKWKTGMTMNEKMVIALQSDNLNNQGYDAYHNGNIQQAIQFYERALSVMPNNDDALNNLRICYSEVGNQEKVNEMVWKLNYLS